jgi:hypothetical protein
VFDTVIPETGENGLLQLVSLMKYELRVSCGAFGRDGGGEVGVDRRGAVGLGVGLEVGMGVGSAVGVGARLAMEVAGAVGSEVDVGPPRAAERVGKVPCSVCTAQKPNPAAMMTLARTIVSSAPLVKTGFLKDVPPRTQERRWDVIG